MIQCNSVVRSGNKEITDALVRAMRGEALKRGLFRSSVGKIINADQNGALNILRKVVGDSEFVRIIGSGHSLCPVRHCNPFNRSVRCTNKVLNK